MIELLYTLSVFIATNRYVNFWVFHHTQTSEKVIEYGILKINYYLLKRKGYYIPSLLLLASDFKCHISDFSSLAFLLTWVAHFISSLLGLKYLNSHCLSVVLLFKVFWKEFLLLEKFTGEEYFMVNFSVKFFISNLLLLIELFLGLVINTFFILSAEIAYPLGWKLIL